MRELEIVACASGRAGLRTTAICSLRRHFSRDFIIVMKFCADDGHCRRLESGSRASRVFPSVRFSNVSALAPATRRADDGPASGAVDRHEVPCQRSPQPRHDRLLYKYLEQIVGGNLPAMPQPCHCLFQVGISLIDLCHPSFTP